MILGCVFGFVGGFVWVVGCVFVVFGLGGCLIGWGGFWLLWVVELGVFDGLVLGLLVGVDLSDVGFWGCWGCLFVFGCLCLFYVVYFVSLILLVCLGFCVLCLGLSGSFVFCCLL